MVANKPDFTSLYQQRFLYHLCSMCAECHCGSYSLCDPEERNNPYLGYTILMAKSHVQIFINMVQSIFLPLGSPVSQMSMDMMYDFYKKDDE